jgi:hypothetical protein
LEDESRGVDAMITLTCFVGSISEENPFINSERFHHTVAEIALTSEEIPFDGLRIEPILERHPSQGREQ